jgi:predicted ArsR family transcriptional regulator
MVKMVESDSRTELISHLKRKGHSTVKELTQQLKLSENAVRHRLSSLERQGFVNVGQRRSEKGRPAQVYALTEAAEGLFPKQYRELLELLLLEAQTQGVLNSLMNGVARRLGAQLQAALEGRQGRDRLEMLRDLLDIGHMLQLERTEAGYELRAFNCLYKTAGSKFEAVCDLIPNIIGLATGNDTNRPVCQRDGQRACVFSIHVEH